MRIITEENGKEKLYVQKMDLAILPCLLEDDAPDIVYWTGLRVLSEINDYNEDEFILIKDEQLANYLKRSENILDYYDFMAYSEKELNEKIETLKAQALQIANRLLLNQNKSKRLALLNLIHYKKSKTYLDIPVSYQIERVK